MAFDSAKEISGTGSNGFWSMDYLETGIFCDSKRLPVRHRVRTDDPIRKVRDNPDLVGAWIVIFLFVATAGEALAQFAGGFW